MQRAEKVKKTVAAERTTNGHKPGVVHLSDLAIEGREFELEGKVYKTKSPIELTLPEIAKIDKMGKQVNQWLPAFGKGNYDEIDMDAFSGLLVDMVVAVSNVPAAVAKDTKWWQQLLVIGMFQSIAGMDFLGEQLSQLGGLPQEAQEKIKESLKQTKAGLETGKTTSISPTP